jgi:hypothetical protein
MHECPLKRKYFQVPIVSESGPGRRTGPGQAREDRDSVVDHDDPSQLECVGETQ